MLVSYSSSVLKGIFGATTNRKAEAEELSRFVFSGEALRPLQPEFVVPA
jgi:hypothetical protein